MEEESNRVLDLMTFWVAKIKAKNYQDLYDINRLSEDLALKLLGLQKNLWVKQCPNSGKTFSSKGFTVFQP